MINPKVTEKSHQDSVVISNISKRFKFLWALKDISLTIEKNTITGFVGPNGAGKSTLLNLLGTIITPTYGSIRIFGRNTNKNSEMLRKNMILFSNQSFLYDDLTGFENLYFWCKLYDIDKKIRNIKLRDYILNSSHDFGVNNWLERPVRELSTGMRKKVDFLRILLIKPDLILLDEPFSGMDPKNIAVFVDSIQEMQKNSTILIASHNLDLIVNLCKRVYILKKGKIADDVKTENFTVEELKIILTNL